LPYTIEQNLVTEAGRIGPDIYRRTLNMSPWLKLTKQEEFPEEMGQIISVLTYERSIPAYPLVWSNVAQSTDNVGGSCLPPVTEVDWAQTLLQYQLQHTALQSPPLCVNDLRIAFQRKEQLTNMMYVLTENTAYAWINRYRDEYTRIATHQIINIDGFPDGLGQGFPLTAPIYALSQGVLKYFYMKLNRDGGSMNPLDRENGRPVYGLITSAEDSENLIKENADIRQDYRFSSRVNELLAPLGVERSYAGFFHIIDDLPARWDFVSGAWVRRYPYTTMPATYGQKAEIDPLYENAAYTDSIIFHNDVMISLVPAPITAPGGNTRFDPVNYRGEFKWLNIPHATENPDGTIGFFRAIFMQASKPVIPDFGYVIRHLRCDCPLDLGVCPTS
jgi:hypothetical protein